MYQALHKVTFPDYQERHVNMMPFIMGDKSTLPEELHDYLPMIESTELPKSGSTAYLTIHESFVEEGKTQRRPGLHTDGTSTSGWGGGGWGGQKRSQGIYLASSDGHCNVWDCMRHDSDEHGAISGIVGEGIRMSANRMYWITDRTPHASVLRKHGGNRQFFRLVAGPIGVWWEKHSTPNPFGVQPKAVVLGGDKFH